MKILIMPWLTVFYGALSLAILQNFYFVTFVKAQTPNVVECVKEVQYSLNREQTVEVCKNATSDTGKCVTEVQYSLNREQTVALCRPSLARNVNIPKSDLCSQIQNVRQLAQQESLDLNTYSLNTLESKYCNKAISNSATTNSQGLRICNQTNVSVNTAIGYTENNKWYAKGWWQLSPGECARVYSSSLKKSLLLRLCP